MVNEFAVYSEYSNKRTSLQPGASVRIFNHVDSEQGESIQLCPDTGIIHLKQGTYHITASAASGMDTNTNTDIQTYSLENEAYCQLSYASKLEQDQAPISIGSQACHDMMPSLLDTCLRVEVNASIVLEYLIDSQERSAKPALEDDSGLCVFSRISILKMAEVTA